MNATEIQYEEDFVWLVNTKASELHVSVSTATVALESLSVEVDMNTFTLVFIE